MKPVTVKMKWLVRIGLAVVLGFVVLGCADVAPAKSGADDAGIKKTSAPTVPQSKKYRKRHLVKIATIGPGGLTVSANAKPQQVVDQVIRHWQRKFDQVLPDRPDLIVVPEVCDSPRGLSRENKNKYYSVRKNQIRDFFGRVARENNCYMVYSAKREIPDGTYRNSSVLLDQKGKVVGVYNKNHPTIGEMDGGTLCGRDAPVFECDFGRVAFAICFDLNFDELRLKYVKSKPDLIIFSSMYHGGLMQAYWAYSCQCHFVGAIAGRATPSEIRNPLGQVIASSTNYCDYAVAEVNLDCRLVHLQNMSAQSNWGRLKVLKKKYGPKVKITDPGLLGPVLVAGEHENISVDEMIEEFDISLWDEDMTKALAMRHKPGNMESTSSVSGDDHKQGWTPSPKLAEAMTKWRPTTIYHEEKVPQYTLQDLMVTADGGKVTNAETWHRKRRPEILEMFRKHVYGRAPGRPDGMTFNVFDLDVGALRGTATRKQVFVNFNGKKDGPGMDMLIYLPDKATRPVPIFIILNFNGNQTVHSDPAIKPAIVWSRNKENVVGHRASEKSRGSKSSRCPVEEILSRGYGLATIYYGDLDPDFHNGFENGVHPMFDKSADGKRPSDAWAAIGAWAWGLSRAMDYFETDGDIDHKRVAVLGHSRLGKTALWASARDDRFALVISNNSGCGGAALSRRRFGETVASINTVKPHWFCSNFKSYSNNEDALPVDQHMLIASIAPRPVYVASADEDLWADPRGEFLACKYAEPAYHLLGRKGLEVENMPELDSPIRKGRIGYHIRTGKHGLTKYDWQRFMDFADHYLQTGTVPISGKTR